jgi:hypothetical protein
MQDVKRQRASQPDPEPTPACCAVPRIGVGSEDVVGETSMHGDNHRRAEPISAFGADRSVTQCGVRALIDGARSAWKSPGSADLRQPWRQHRDFCKKDGKTLKLLQPHANKSRASHLNIWRSKGRPRRNYLLQTGPTAKTWSRKCGGLAKPGGTASALYWASADRRFWEAVARRTVSRRLDEWRPPALFRRAPSEAGNGWPPGVPERCPGGLELTRYRVGCISLHIRVWEAAALGRA